MPRRSVGVSSRVFSRSSICMSRHFIRFRRGRNAEERLKVPARTKRVGPSSPSRLSGMTARTTETLPAAWAEPIDAFALFIELEKGRALLTVESYESDLVQCARFLAQRGAGSWETVTSEEAAAW